jgi:hypothetical protein
MGGRGLRLGGAARAAFFVAKPTGCMRLRQGAYGSAKARRGVDAVGSQRVVACQT